MSLDLARFAAQHRAGEPEKRPVPEYTGDAKADWLLSSAGIAKGRDRLPAMRLAARRLGELRAESPAEPVVQWAALEEVARENGALIKDERRFRFEKILKDDIDRARVRRGAELAPPHVAHALDEVRLHLVKNPNAAANDWGSLLETMERAADDLAEVTHLPVDNIFREIVDAAGLTAPQRRRAWREIFLQVRAARRNREDKIRRLDDLALTARAKMGLIYAKGPTRALVDPFAHERIQAAGPTPFEWADPDSLPRRQWLYGTYLIRKEISATLAPGGVGKTSLQIVEALALASGKPLLGIAPVQRARAWLWNGEEPVEELRRRIMAACKHYGLRPSDLRGWLFVDTADTLDLVLAEETRDGTRVHKPLVDNLVAWISDRRIDALFVDPFISTHNVNENDNNAIQKAATAWKEVARRANAAISIAHHTPKLRGREATAEDARGAKSFVDKCRVSRALNPMSVAEAKELGVSPIDRRRYFSFDPTEVKANMSPAIGLRQWFRSASVALGAGRNGDLDLGESVGVVEAWTPVGVPEPEASGDQVAALLKLLSAREWRSAANLTKEADWLGVAVAEAFDIDLQAKESVTRVKALITKLRDRGVIATVKVRDPKTRKLKPIEVSGQRAAELAELGVSEE